MQQTLRCIFCFQDPASLRMAMATDGQQLQLKIRDGQHQTCGEISKAEWKSKLSSKIFHALLRNAMIPSFFLRVSPQCRVPLTFEKRWKAPHPCREPSVPPFSSSLFRCPRFRVILEEPEGGAKFDESTDGGAGDWFFGKTSSDQQRNIKILWVFLLCYFWIITYYNVIRFVPSGYLT
jgi:hypothetical protein